MPAATFTSRIAMVVGVALLGVSGAEGGERLPIAKVDPDAFVDDCQVTLKGGGDDHTAMVWWIPLEFWSSVLSRDANAGEDEKQEILGALSGVTLLAAVQSDISSLGAFGYYGKDEVASGMKVTYTDADGRTFKVKQVGEVGKDLQIVLAMLKPVLEAAMGELGNNMHFYVLDDSGAGGRMIDPYKHGKISVSLEKRNGEVLEGGIRMPANSLFAPKKCPNGEDADITWNFCPWTGKKLE